MDGFIGFTGEEILVAADESSRCLGQRKVIENELGHRSHQLGQGRRKGSILIGPCFAPFFFSVKDTGSLPLENAIDKLAVIVPRGPFLVLGIKPTGTIGDTIHHFTSVGSCVFYIREC